MSTTATKFEKAKEVYTVGDGDFMFRMHTQPMKPFQIESMSGADPDILLGGGEVHYLPRKFDTQKQKRKQQQVKKTGQIERRRLRRLFQHLVHMVRVQRVSLGEVRKGRRHDLCVIVSPYTNTYNRIIFDFSQCVDDGGGMGVS